MTCGFNILTVSAIISAKHIQQLRFLLTVEAEIIMVKLYHCDHQAGECYINLTNKMISSTLKSPIVSQPKELIDSHTSGPFTSCQQPPR